MSRLNSKSTSAVLLCLLIAEERDEKTEEKGEKLKGGRREGET